VREMGLGAGFLQSLFMCSRTWTWSLGCRARSPVSVGWYAYRAEAMDSIGGDWAYAGGGSGAGAGICV
jgi:hypothetical protein